MTLTLQDLGNIGEFVGSAGVFVSLVYLAIQIRIQNHDSRIALINSVAERWQIFMITLTDKDLASVWLDGLMNFPDMPPEDAQRFSTLAGNATTILDTFYRHYLDGRLGEDVWLVKRQILKEVMAYPGIQNWTRERVDWVTPHFHELLQTMIAEQKDEKPKAFESIRKDCTRKPKSAISNTNNSNVD